MAWRSCLPRIFKTSLNNFRYPVYLIYFSLFCLFYLSLLEISGKLWKLNYQFLSKVKSFWDNLLEILNCTLIFSFHQYMNFQFNRSYLGLRLELQVQKTWFLVVILNCTQRWLFYFYEFILLFLSFINRITIDFQVLLQIKTCK